MADKQMSPETANLIAEFIKKYPDYDMSSGFMGAGGAIMENLKAGNVDKEAHRDFFQLSRALGAEGFHLNKEGDPQQNMAGWKQALRAAAVVAGPIAIAYIAPALAGMGGGAGAALPSTTIGTGAVTTTAGAGLGAGVGAGATTGALATGASVGSRILQGAQNVAPILSNAAGQQSNARQQEIQNEQTDRQLAIQEQAAGQTADRERLRSSVRSSNILNATPSAVSWGGPGSGLRGELPKITGGFTGAMANLDPRVKEMADTQLKNNVVAQLSGSGQPTQPVEDEEQRRRRRGESTGEKILGGVATGASILGAFSGRR